MKFLIPTMLLLLFLVIPVKAVEYTAPSVPESGAELMPERESIPQALGEMVQKALSRLHPDVHQAVQLGCGCIATVILISLFQTLWGEGKTSVQWVGLVGVCGLLLNSTNTMIRLGTSTITEIYQYGKLLLPVMTAALAAQGGVSTSGALYAGTSLFGALLTSLISNVLMPMVYGFLALSLAAQTLGEGILKNLKETIRGFFGWCLKTILTVFTTYMSITGVISGTTDAAALKATKVVISSVVPMVGSILSDASEAVLVSAALAKNAAGIYGIFAVISVFLLPFFRIGLEYLVLKITAGICGVFECRQITGLICDVSTAMGMLLAMTGSVCLLQLISTVCFLKGVS